MQTLYYTTSNFIRHTDNVVDLSEYRRKLDLARQEPVWQEDEERSESQARAASPRPRTAHRRGLTLDACASMGILVMTLTFTMRVLFL